MAQSDSVGFDLDAFTSSIASVARLLASAGTDDHFRVLHAEIARICPIDNLIVYAFAGSTAPRLLGSNLQESRLRKQMEDFTDGLFLLDPFVIEAQNGASGVMRLREIIPDDFFESEFYRYHYTYTDVLDEVRFVVPLGSDRVVHVFVERERGRPLFSDLEYGMLRALWPAVRLFVQQRMRRIDGMAEARDRPQAMFDLATRIRAMGSLSARECQVVELILRGHATKSIARTLEIEAGTVTNHKRNIYAKLDVHSQAQLFEAFLRTIASI